MTRRHRLSAIAVSVSAIGLAPIPSRAVVPSCNRSVTLETRVVANPATSAGSEVATWDVRVPPCARVLVYQIVDADTGTPVAREAVFPPHTVRRERWEKLEGAMRLHLHLQNLGAPTGDARSTRKVERWTRRVRAVVRWFPAAGA